MYARDYKLIKKFVNRSGMPYWIRRVLLSDDEFIHDAQQTIDLHRLMPKKFPLKKEMKSVIRRYAKQASLTQHFIRRKKREDRD
jgi:hypothetical protein